MNFYLRFFALVLAAGLTFLTAQAQETRIKRSQLPAAVEKTVAKESEGATIKGFAKEIEKGQTFYELELIVDGHTKDVLMDKHGNVVEVEEQVSMDSLPAAVQEALKQAAGAGTIGIIESITKNGTLVSYEAHVKHGKKRSEIKVGPNGETMK
jgi:uncharacterized membrane protein YkoI